MWLIITILSYAFNSIALLINKFLLTKKITNPAVYAIFTCFLMALAVILLPFDWRTPNGYQFFIEVVSGFTFGLGVYFMYSGLKAGETSRVIPIIGGVQPLIVLPLAWLWLGETVSLKFLVAFVLIIVGTVLISYGGGKIEKKAYWWSVLSAIFFAISIVTLKDTFNSQASFVTPFVLSRLGCILFGFLLLLWPKNRRDIARELKTPNAQSGGLFIASQISGGLASLLLNLAFAISVGVTALINALQGLQYVFLLAAIIFLSNKFPKVLKEDIKTKILAQKILATILIIVGLIVVAF